MKRKTSLDRISKRIDDLQHDAVWLIQHGHEEKSFAEVNQELDIINKRIKRWSAHAEKLLDWEDTAKQYHAV